MFSAPSNAFAVITGFLHRYLFGNQYPLKAPITREPTRLVGEQKMPQKKIYFSFFLSHRCRNNKIPDFFIENVF